MTIMVSTATDSPHYFFDAGFSVYNRDGEKFPDGTLVIWPEDRDTEGGRRPLAVFAAGQWVSVIVDEDEGEED